MRRMLSGLVSLSMLLSAGMMAACCTTSGTCSTSTDCTDCCSVGGTLFSPRSQSVNASRDLVGWQSLINKYFEDECENFYGAFSITPEYTRSFKPAHIANFFFGQDYCTDSKLVISGSAKGTIGDGSGTNAVARGEHEWLAEYFGLPINFVSEVTFEPRITNYLVDLSLYLGLDELLEGSFFSIHAPIVHTRWKLGACETVSVAGANGFAAGRMDDTEILRSALPANWLAAMKGVTWGDMQEALKYGKISDCTLTKTRLSDIQMALGWNFLLDDDYHFGLMIRGAAPTGNAPTAEYLFEPIVGNGKHWELGGGLTGHARLWTGCDEDSWLDVYADANITHLFKASQYRSFDLTDKPNSRYMLVAEMKSTTDLYTAATNTAIAAAGSEPKYQYAGKLFPLINKSTCCTDVSIALQGDLAIKFAYTSQSDCGMWTFDLGYNLWGRSGEKFDSDCCTDTCCLESNKYALIGDAQMYGFSYQTPAVPTALSASESKATINAGTNIPVGTAYTAVAARNRSVDNALYAFYDTTNADELLLYNTTATLSADNSVLTSKDPVLLSCDNLNLCKTPSALSHKVFAHFNYIWTDEEEGDCTSWDPFLGLGGEVEFSGKTDCGYSALSQWGVWVKGGLSFD